MYDYLHPLVLTVHLFVGLAVIGLVLLQHGKGADMGAAFGSGASGSLFGSSGSANFLSRTTAVLAAVFFVTSLSLSYMASTSIKPAASVLDTARTAPATAPTSTTADVPVPTAPSNAQGDSKAGNIPK